MLKRFLFVIGLCIPLMTLAQKEKPSDPKWAVPEENGKVVFKETFNVPGKNKAQIYRSLQQFVENLLVDPSTLGGSDIPVEDSINGIVTTNRMEWIVFKRSALETDYARFDYQLAFIAQDSSFTAIMRGINFLYNITETFKGDIYTAEDWITDAVSINKKKNTFFQKNLKFRKSTILRKNEIFKAAFNAVSQGK